MNKIAYERGYRKSVRNFLKTAYNDMGTGYGRAPEGMSIEDLQAIRDDYYGEMNDIWNPTLAQQRTQLRNRAGGAGSLAGLALTGGDLMGGDHSSGTMLKSLAAMGGGRMAGEFLGGLGADKMTEEETDWQRMTPAQQNVLRNEYLENFRRKEIPNAPEQKRDAMIGGGLLGSVGGTALGAGLGAIFKRPGLGALLGLPIGAGAGVGLGSLRGTREYPSLEEIGVGD